MAICVRHPVVARRDLTLKMAQLQRWLQHTHTHTHTHTLTQTHTHTDTHTNTHTQLCLVHGRINFHCTLCRHKQMATCARTHTHIHTQHTHTIVLDTLQDLFSLHVVQTQTDGDVRARTHTHTHTHTHTYTHTHKHTHTYIHTMHFSTLLRGCVRFLRRCRRQTHYQSSSPCR